MEQKRAMLVIMDGWGLGKVKSADAIQNAKTPFVSSLYTRFPNTTLTTCGEAVGLPDGQMGNSEVGHLNLGAGRVVYQELQRIHVAVRSGELASNPVLLQALAHAKATHKPVHLIGLVSDGGVHSHISHVLALASICQDQGLNQVFVHAFTDGRDTDPKSGLGFMRTLKAGLDASTGQIASVTGRYYAMDRDKRWERVKLAYDALVHGKGKLTMDPLQAIEASYANNVTDEFIQPIICTDPGGKAVAPIREGDVVICFNFRTDRCREITQVLTQEAFPEFGMEPLKLTYITMTEYDKTFRDVGVIFRNDNLEKTLGEVLEAHKLQQIRIAETEKYPHVTFFFSGGREKPFERERRIMVPSPKVATYDLKPEMSAIELTDAIVPEIESKSAHFICLNYANTDMVGHTGDFQAAIKAAETVDKCVERVVTAALESDYTVFLTADHGNADFMINEDGSPNTAHTLNPVPLFVIDRTWKGKVKSGKLGDIAPSILTVMQIPIPVEMTGDVLI